MIFEWIDLIWVPVAAIAVHTGQRVKAVAFVLACVFVMRLQIQLMEDIGFPGGFFDVMVTPLYIRGLITYSLFILGYLLLSYYSPETDRFVYMAASITIFVAAFCVSTAVMVL